MFFLKMTMDYGESRHIGIRIHNIKNEDFTILSATYEWIYPESGEVEASGSAEIDEDIIDAFVTPANRGKYILKFTYQIGDETLVDKIEVTVR